MSQLQYSILGHKAETRPIPATELVTVTQARRLTPGRARDGATSELKVAADEVVCVTLDNGFQLWTSADDLIREHGRQTLSRDGGQVWEFDRLTPRRVSDGVPGSERGLAGLVIKTLDIFGVDLKGQTAAALGRWAENRQFGSFQPDLYSCSLDDGFKLKKPDRKLSSEKPLLVFLHGTASSVGGGFGKLWADDNREGKAARDALKKIYEDRVLAFQHRTLTESPLTNAFDLVKCLPEGAKLHLVSHSRGGLIGELLSLSGCEPIPSAEQFDKLFDVDRTIAQQLGLPPLDTDAIKDRKEAYKAELAKLKDLLDALKARKIAVERFVRIACPARGTTLASGRLDRFFSVLNFLAGKAVGSGFFSDISDFLLGVAKQRTDPRVLPGLEAMMPGSALTRLLQDPSLVTEADLSVIAGDTKGDSLWSQIKLLAANWFYGADHDLVVNTGSMFGGLKRENARFLQDDGADVNHFEYFTNKKSIEWLRNGLARKDGEESGFRPIQEAKQEEPRWREAVRRSRAAAAPQPLAIVLPGTMGSTISVDQDKIWLDYRAIFLGKLGQLRPGLRDAEAKDVLDDYYAPLLDFLAASHRLEVFPYDWRLSLLDAAKKLTDKLAALLPEAERDRQPVRIVAHSMGGLVVRAMLGDTQGARLWRRCLDLGASRIMMLGTPNLGSYEALRWLTGHNPTEAKLQLLDRVHDTNGLIDIVRSFPGLLELLPFDGDSPDFSEAAFWSKLKQDLTAQWSIPEGDLLQRARATWTALKQSPLDGMSIVYVAGCQNVTVSDYRIVEDDSFFSSGRKRLQFLGVHEGDGTVTWKSGFLPKVTTWYVENTAHDELCTQRRAFPGYLDLLTTGATKLLPDTPPAGARAAGKPEEFIIPDLPPADCIPSERDLRAVGFGPGRPMADAQQEPATPAIKVSIRHGDLAYARHAVLVGHYRGDVIINAEKSLDDRFDGALTRRMALNLYPGRQGTHALFFNNDKAAKPSGAVVVGLGQVGELTAVMLQTSVRDALLEFALQIMQWPADDDRFGPADGVRSAAVSCLLVGSGTGGVSLQDSIESILRAAMQANERLGNKDLSGKVLIDHVEFIEYYEDAALNAAKALERLAAGADLSGKVIWEPRVVEEGEGRLYRLSFEEPPGWWHPLEVVEEKLDNRSLGLRFVTSTDRARAEVTQATGQLRLAEGFIAEASNSPLSNAEAGKTLFEMLLPTRLKELAPHQTNLILLVDEVSARYPWELLEDRWSKTGRPPAVLAGMLRQLKTTQFRPRPASTASATALVVGDPDTKWDLFPDLPGAREETQRVASLLQTYGYNVTSCIGEEAKTIIQGLHKQAWRILHLAGHGAHDFVFEPETPADAKSDAQTATNSRRPASVQLISGMIIGEDVFLTPGDVEQMRWTPELVFINCCHLGKTGGVKRKFSDLAANLGVQFIKMGVKAVIAAGWAVQDDAARAFAESFYARMLGGETFGEAVRAAREEIWTQFPDVNTWGAYQCYGDPGFRFYEEGGVPPRAKERAYYSPGELIASLENLTERMRMQSGRTGDGDDPTPQWRTEISGYLARTPEKNWLDRSDVAGAIGLAYGELRDWAKAIEWLEKAIAGEKSNCPLRVIEQWSNFKVRLAAEQWFTRRAQPSVDVVDLRSQCIRTIKDAILKLEQLTSYKLQALSDAEQNAQTTERFNLLGGSYKRLALIETESKRRCEALENMATQYGGAFKRTGKSYAWTNWVTAQLMAKRIHEAAECPDVADIETAAVHQAEDLKKILDKSPNFWDCATAADIDLVRLIAACSATGAPTENVSKLKDEVIRGYQRARRRGSSPRELSSLAENLDFVIEMAEPRDPLITVLQAIRRSFPTVNGSPSQ